MQENEQHADTLAGNDPWVGQTLGGVYAIARALGSGGMGAVYEAKHVHLPRRYAVKILKTQGNDNAVQRFIQEAQLLCELDHPNIVAVHNVARAHDGTPYIVMELVEGISVGDLLLQGEALDIDRALRITEQVCAALGEAHRRGIIHRDVKGDNILLLDDDRVKVVDFGIAFSPEEEKERLTQDGQILGTPHYMAPEQVKGDEIDARVDLYALGVLLYEMVTGKPPFDGLNNLQVMWKHTSEQALAPSFHNPAAARFDAIIEKALAKEPADRFQSAEEFCAALVEPAEPKKKKKQSMLFAAGIAAISALILIVWWPKPAPESQEATPLPSALPPATPAAIPAAVAKIAEETPTSASDAGGEIIDEDSEKAKAEPAAATDDILLLSIPNGASVRVGGKKVGVTPFRWKNGKIGTAYSLEKSGYRRAKGKLDGREKIRHRLSRLRDPLDHASQEI